MATRRAGGARADEVEEALAPHCPHCGASLPIELGRAEVRCDARYEAAFYKQNEKATTVFIFGTLGVATFLTFALVAWAITRQIPMGVPVLYFEILIVGWGISRAAFARGWAIIYAIPPLGDLAKIGIARCRGCGAMRPFQAGEAPCLRLRICGAARWSACAVAPRSTR